MERLPSCRCERFSPMNIPVGESNRTSNWIQPLGYQPWYNGFIIFHSTYYITENRVEKWSECLEHGRSLLQLHSSHNKSSLSIMYSRVFPRNMNFRPPLSHVSHQSKVKYIYFSIIMLVNLGMLPLTRIISCARVPGLFMIRAQPYEASQG